MFSLTKEQGKDVLALIASAIETAKKDPTIKETISNIMQEFRTDYVDACNGSGYETKAECIERVYNSIADELGFDAYSYNAAGKPMLTFGLYAANLLLKELKYEDMEKLPVESILKEAANAKLAPNNDFEDENYGQYSQTYPYTQSHTPKPPELADPRLRRVLGK